MLWVPLIMMLILAYDEVAVSYRSRFPLLWSRPLFLSVFLQLAGSVEVDLQRIV